MKKVICTVIVLLILGDICMHAQHRGDSLLVMFWNVENFFDYHDGGKGDSDRDFSSFGSRRWTRKRFYAKCNAVAKSIFWMSDRYGRLPDMVSFAEIENRNVLYRLLNDTALRKTDYGFIHFEGRDRRGIDVALIYRKSEMAPICTGRGVPVYEGDTLDTRDILHVRMRIGGSGDSLDFIVNHHPSKFGGEKLSEGRRVAAMECLKTICDSLDGSRTVAMGDFNDTPGAPQFSLIEDVLVNKAVDLHKAGRGTIRYEGKWDLIDMFMVSPDLDSRTVTDIVEIPFLMVRDSAHPGMKPLRTYSGPRYLGGVSDHCPVILWIFS